MVVDHAHRLHECVAGGRTDERPPETLHLLAQRGRFLRHRLNIASRSQRPCPVRLELPKELRQRSLTIDDIHRPLRIVDCRLNLATMPHDFGIGQKTVHLAGCISGDLAKIKITEGLSKGIIMAGEQLKTHFPFQSDDVNELSDDISIGS